MKILVSILIFVFSALVWVWTHTDKPLSPRELWNLEQSEVRND